MAQTFQLGDLRFTLFGLLDDGAQVQHGGILGHTSLGGHLFPAVVDGDRFNLLQVVLQFGARQLGGGLLGIGEGGHALLEGCDPGFFCRFVLGERGAHLVFQGIHEITENLAVGIELFGFRFELIGQLLAKSLSVHFESGAGVGQASDLLAPLGGGCVWHDTCHLLAH